MVLVRFNVALEVNSNRTCALEISSRKNFSPIYVSFQRGATKLVAFAIEVLLACVAFEVAFEVALVELVLVVVFLAVVVFVLVVVLTTIGGT